MHPLSLEKAKIRFLLLEGVHPNALTVLNNQDYTNIEYLRTGAAGATGAGPRGHPACAGN